MTWNSGVNESKSTVRQHWGNDLFVFLEPICGWWVCRVSMRIFLIQINLGGLDNMLFLGLSIRRRVGDIRWSSGGLQSYLW